VETSINMPPVKQNHMEIKMEFDWTYTNSCLLLPFSPHFIPNFLPSMLVVDGGNLLSPPLIRLNAL
jgi:hypothetical protein